MPDLITQTFIREHGLPALVERYAIKVRRHGEFPNLVHLKYDQINSPMAEPIVRQCRGLILDEDDGWRVVSYPFDKFFNHGEGHAAAIDWSTAEVQEKADGSLMVLYWYAGQWRVASSGTPDASGPVYGHSGTFADLFWETWRAMGWVLPPPFVGNILPTCFMFELMTTFNRVVVHHERPRLALIGAREMYHAFHERVSLDTAATWGWETVRAYPLQTIDDVVEAARVLTPDVGEGYVVVDAAFNRIKVKSPAYVAMAHMKDTCGPSKLIDLVRQNESAEFLAYFPNLKAAHDVVAERFAAVCAEADAAYAEHGHHADQKAFAMAVKSLPASAALFARRAGKCGDARSFFAGASMGVVERLLNLDDAVLRPLLCGVVNGVKPATANAA